MKRIKILASALLATALLGSCAGDLELAPIDHYGAGNFWKNTAHVQGEVVGLHKQMRDFYWTMYVLGEMRGGTVKSGTSSIGGISLNAPDIKNNVFTSDKVGMGGWAGYYSFILQLNLFIDKVTNECPFLSEAERKQYLAIGHGMRAYAYFWLYRTYGGVPIEVDPTVAKKIGDIQALYKERATAEATLNFIKEDINKSEEFYGTNVANDRKHWSKDATLMLKGEVYLWSAKVATGDHQPGGEADLRIAETSLQAVISSGRYQLISEFSNLFNADPTKKITAEHIYSLSFDKEEATNNGAQFLSAETFLTGLTDMAGNALPNNPLQQGGTGFLREQYKDGFVKSYDAEDTRQNGTFFQVQYTITGNQQGYAAFMIKYLGRMLPDGKRHYDTNIPVYRFADAVLMLAEVKNGLNDYAGCATLINLIRQRAYGTNYNASKAYTAGDYAANELAILKERDKEFVAESKRWFDLRRLHDANKKPLVFSATASYWDTDSTIIEPVLPTTEEYKLLWPIDKGTLNADPKLTQNPGY